MKKVAFLDTVHPVLKEGLQSLGWECSDFTKSELFDINRLIAQYHGVVIRSRFLLDRQFLMQATSLEFVARAGAGVDNIDQEYCESKGIKLFSASEGNRNAVAEHALGMLLSMFNNLHSADAEIRKGIWNREANRGVELEGKTVGIIGYGNNGSAFAKILNGFDVRVIAYDKYKSGFGDESVEEVSLEELVKNSDVISLHIPETEETIEMINAEFLKSVTKPFYLINLSRGKIVRTRDLLASVAMGKVKGACLDVLEFEKSSFEDMFKEGKENLPETFRALLFSNKILLSPHVGGWTVESHRKISEVLLEKITSDFS
ncbi:hypothetical protein JYT72_01975 [Crocinitomix catalasitica]|nr:hypothetical protein [Crocinitomix catalasitica]